MRRLWYSILLCVTLVFASWQVTRATSLPRVDLILWHQAGQITLSDLGIAQIFDAWAAVNAPGSTLTIVEKYNDDLPNDLLAQATSPDLIWAVADSVPTFVNKGLLRPVDDLADMTQFLPTLVDVVRSNQKTYGVPVQAGNFLLMYYNKQYVKEPPKTFADLIKISLDLQQQNAKIDGFVPFAYNQSDPYWVFPIAHAFGATEFSADGMTPALDSDKWIRAFQLVQDLKYKSKIEPENCDYVCADQGFRDGKVALTFNGDWAVQGTDTYVKALGDNLGIAPWPSVGSVPDQQLPAPFIFGEYLMLPTSITGDKLTTAQAFIKFMATDEKTILAWTVPNRHLPALVDALKQPEVTQDPILAQTSKVLQLGIASPVQPAMDCVWRALTKSYGGVMSDSKTPTDAAQGAQKTALDCIAKLKSAATPVQ